ncbi:MAG: hypothetical protein ACRDD2_08555 [Sarcina sp.]
MKYVKFEKRIISWVSLVFTIIMVIVIAIALFRVSDNLLNVADNNDVQNANPQTTATGPVTQDFTTHPVNEQYLEQLAVQFNNQNTGTNNSTLVSQSSTNQDVVLLGINGELNNPPAAQTPINNVTAPGESASDATSNSDGGNSNSNSSSNPITEIINDIFHHGNSNSSTNNSNSNSNNSNSNGNSNATNNSGNTPTENTNSNNSNGTNSSDVNNANNGSNNNANSGNSNTNNTGTSPAGNSQNGNSSTGGNTSTGAAGAATNNNSIANKIKQMENMLKNNTTKPTGN